MALAAELRHWQAPDIMFSSLWPCLSAYITLELLQAQILNHWENVRIIAIFFCQLTIHSYIQCAVQKIHRLCRSITAIRNTAAVVHPTVRNLCGGDVQLLCTWHRYCHIPTPCHSSGEPFTVIRIATAVQTFHWVNSGRHTWTGVKSPVYIMVYIVSECYTIEEATLYTFQILSVLLNSLIVILQGISISTLMNPNIRMQELGGQHLLAAAQLGLQPSLSSWDTIWCSRLVQRNIQWLINHHLLYPSTAYTRWNCPAGFIYISINDGVDCGACYMHYSRITLIPLSTFTTHVPT